MDVLSHTFLKPSFVRHKSHFDDSVFFRKIKAGPQRTYFIDVRKTRRNDYYLTVTENQRLRNGAVKRHRIRLYKEDFNNFLKRLQDCINHVKVDLMPNFDYDAFEGQSNRWEENEEEELYLNNEENGRPREKSHDDKVENEDDMSW